MSLLEESELKSILKFGLTSDQIKGFDIICLPENLDTAEALDQLYDAPDAIVLSKLLKAQGINCGNSYDLHLPHNSIERRSKEKWFGIVYLRNKIMIPVFVGVLSSLITSEISDSSKSTKQPIPKVHIELKIQRQHYISNIKYDGDPQTLIVILKNMEADTTQKK